MSRKANRGLHRASSAWKDRALNFFGPTAAWLKKYFVFPIVSGLFATGSVAIMLLVADDEGAFPSWVTPVIVIAAVLAFLSTIGDAIADRYDARYAEWELAEVEAESEGVLADVTMFIERCTEVFRSSGVTRTAMLKSLRPLLVNAAAKSLPRSRASYYILRKDSDGTKRLEDPSHHSEGRDDQSDRPFLERVNPELTIWSLLDRADTEPQVVEYPDQRDEIDWGKVTYTSYYSIPVKHKATVFGMLSVNSAYTGVITPSHRRAIIAMARAYAMALVAAGRKSEP